MSTTKKIWLSTSDEQIKQWYCTVLDTVYNSFQNLHHILIWMKTTDNYSKQVYFKLTGLWSSTRPSVANQPEITENTYASNGY